MGKSALKIRDRQGAEKASAWKIILTQFLSSQLSSIVNIYYCTENEIGGNRAKETVSVLSAYPPGAPRERRIQCEQILLLM